MVIKKEETIKKEKNPLVSTVIPTFKRADMLSRAIDSVLNQSYTNVEVIIVDDNNPSSDYRKTTEVTMERYNGNPKVRYIKHEKNQNGSVARNTGIHKAKGKYICFLDDDNYFYQKKIEKQVKYLFKNPEYKAVYCGVELDNRNIIPCQAGDLTYEQLAGTNIIDTNTILMEKEVILQFGGWDERLKRNQDVSFMLRYFKTGNKVGVISEALAFYDLSDRSNVANPRNNEKNFDLFLYYYDEQVLECEKKFNNAKKNIYSLRYRGVILNYLKKKDVTGAIKLYWKMLLIAPIIFNKHMLIGFLKKVIGKPLI